MDTCDHPIKLGSILFTMVEPGAGYEAEYNRWYERDHLYSGVMIFLALNVPYLVVPPLAALREVAIRLRRAPAGS